MKLNVCDVCLKRHAGKLHQSTHYFTWKNSAIGYRIRIDLCPDHRNEVKTRARFDLRTAEQAGDWVSHGCPEHKGVTPLPRT